MKKTTKEILSVLAFIVIGLLIAGLIESL